MNQRDVYRFFTYGVQKYPSVSRGADAVLPNPTRRLAPPPVNEQLGRKRRNGRRFGSLVSDHRRLIHPSARLKTITHVAVVQVVFYEVPQGSRVKTRREPGCESDLVLTEIPDDLRDCLRRQRRNGTSLGTGVHAQRA